MNSEGQRMVYIPGGSFEMGLLDPNRPQLGPPHQVTLSPFYIGAFEVTKGSFRAFTREQGTEKNSLN